MGLQLLGILQGPALLQRSLFFESNFSSETECFMLCVSMSSCARRQAYCFAGGDALQAWPECRFFIPCRFKIIFNFLHRELRIYHSNILRSRILFVDGSTFDFYVVFS